MFEITDNKVFMDSVHGYISVPKCFVQHIIDTEMFQRLRNIDQTGMRILYPNAKHDRFGHSLGVYHLGCKALDALFNNFSKEPYWNISSDVQTTLFWAKNKVLFMIACLLHDIGHTPFSHSLETQIIQNSMGRGNVLEFKQSLIQLITEKEQDSTENIKVDSFDAAAHEQMGAKYILENMRDNISAIYDDLIEMGYPGTRKEGILYAEHYSGKVVLTKDENELDRDICFVARMILGLKYTDYRPEKQLRNCFIELLNSSNFDVDKLDYALRDTQMSGISNIGVDVDRLLGAINIIVKTVYKQQRVFQKTFTDTTIYALKTGAVFEDAEKQKDAACFHIIGQLKGIIRLAAGTKVTIGQQSRFESLGSEKSRINIQTECTHFFSEGSVVYYQGEKRKPEKNGDGREQVFLYDNNQNPFQCVIENAELLDKDFNFQVIEPKGGGAATMDLKLNGWCDLTLCGNCQTKGVLTVTGKADIFGSFERLEVLKDDLQDCIPKATAYDEFCVGYKKQAINVIANVMEARNYLYLWIYAHHKVVYYANYLVPAISRQVFAEKKAWGLTYDDLCFLDDSYVWSEIKKAYQMDNTMSDMTRDVCKELFSRKYKYSVYKSLAEYEMIFEIFSDEDKQKIKEWFAKHLSENAPYCLYRNSSQEKTAGYLNEECLSKMKSVADEKKLENINKIRNIVFVEAAYKSKLIDPHGTFIVMGDRTVAMEEIPLLWEKYAVTDRNRTFYFYLYYELDEPDQKLSSLVTREMRALLQLFLKDEISREL